MSLSRKKISFCQKTSTPAPNARCKYCYEEHSENGAKGDTTNQMEQPEDRRNLAKMQKVQTAFTDFCGSTSLHGWQHLSESHREASTAKGKYIWMFIVAASIGVASFFIFTSVDDFTSKYVVTNIETTTASLHVSYILSSVCNHILVHGIKMVIYFILM